MISSDFDKIVLKRNNAGGRRCVHAPGEAEDTPLCVEQSVGVPDTKRGWRTRPSNIIPDGFYPDCTHCLKVIEEQDF